MTDLSSPGDDEPPLPKPIAFLGVLFIGFLWAWLIASAMLPKGMTLGLLALPLPLGPLARKVTRGHVDWKEMAFAAAALLDGYAIAYVALALST